MAAVLLAATCTAYGHNVDEIMSLAEFGSMSQQDLYLTVTINGQLSSPAAHFVSQNGRLLATTETLHAIGLEIQSPEPGTGLLALDAVSGLRYVFDASRQSVDITVPDRLRRPYSFGAPTDSLPAATAGRGLVLNYDAYYQYFDTSQLAVWNDLRYFNAHGIFESTGATYWDAWDRRHTRFDTSWSRSDPQTMRTLRVGDTITGGLDWTRPVRMGGVQWSSDFSLRPDLVTFPVPAYTGTAVVPSTVDLYVNNIRRLSTQVPNGPFVINDAPGITGAGTATVVTRDALGRAITTTLPLYIDQRMLAPGLSSYSLEAGFLRQRYGLSSFDYASSPAASASVRHGWSDGLTLESHAEVAHGLYNAGVGALVKAGTRGVINAAIANSAGDGSGTQIALGYQWIQPALTLDLQTIRQFGQYRDLGSVEGTPAPNQIDRATLSIPVGNRSSMALSYIGYKIPQYAPSRITSIAYNTTLNGYVSLNMSAYTDMGPRSDKGFLLGISIALDNHVSMSAYGGRQNGQATLNASVNRQPDYDGGWGWGAQAGRNAATQWEQAQTQYRGRYGDLTAFAQDMGGQQGFSLGASGAAVLMDGDMQLSRRVYDGFAMVSTDGVADIPVLHENRVIGTTNHSGHYLVPDLNPYQRNHIAIDALALPADMKIATTAQVVVPQARSGVLVTFPISQYQAARIILQDAHGEAIQVGAAVRHEESGASTIVGYDGETFLDGLQAVNHLRVEYEDKTCTATFPFQGGTSGSLPTIGPVTCAAHPE